MIPRSFSKMPQNKARKTNRENLNADMMKKAIEAVLQKHKSVRSSAKLNSEDKMTLTRYLKDVKDEDDSHTTMTFKKIVYYNTGNFRSTIFL